MANEVGDKLDFIEVHRKAALHFALYYLDEHFSLSL